MRFNSIFAAILFVFMAFSVAVIVFVQTKTFGELLTHVITDVSEKKAQTKVSISDISISLFPPGLELNKVSVLKNFTGDKTLTAELGRVGFYLNLIEIEERKLAFGEIKVTDSEINYTFPENDDPPIEQIDEDQIEYAFGFSDKLPVRVDTLLLENTRIIANHKLMDVRRLKLFKKDESYTLRFHIGNLHPVEGSEVRVDEVWADADITKNDLSIQRLRIQHDVQTLLLKGNVSNWHLLKNADFDFVGESQIFLKGLPTLFDLPEMIEFHAGSAHLVFNLNKQQEKISGASGVNLKDVRSSVANADLLNVDLSLDDDKITINKMEFSREQQKLHLLTPVVIADIVKKTYLTESLPVEVEGVTLNNALRVLGPELSVLKGQLFGRLTFSYRKGDLFFIPEDGFVIKNLGLITSDSNFKVLMANKAELRDANFAVVNNEFQMTSMINLPNSRLEVDGFVNKNEVRFSVVDAQVDLDDLGDVADLGLKGKGVLSVDVSGPLSDTELNFKGKLNELEILGYKLGTSELEVGIGIEQSTVNIKKLESVYGKTQITGNGAVNYSNLDIALGVNTRSTNYNDLTQILSPILSELDFLPSDLELNAKVDAYIYGKTKLEDLKVKANLQFQDLIAYGEGLEEGGLNIELINETLSLKNFNAKKDDGKLSGDFAYKLNTEEFSLYFNWGNLELSGFNLSKKLDLNFDGSLNGRIKGHGKTSNYELSIDNVLSDTQTSDHKFDDSIIKLKLMPGRIAGDVNFFGNLFQSVFDLSLRQGIRSNITAKLDVPDLKPISVAILGQHLQPEEFSGRLGLKLKGEFEQGLSDLDLSAQLSEWIFNHQQFEVNYTSSTPQFLISKGKVQKWDMNIRESGLFLQTKGKGKFGESVSLFHSMDVDSKIMEVLLAQVLSADGFIYNTVKIEGKGEEYNFSANSKSKDLGLSLEGSPFPLNNLKYEIEYAHNRLNLKQFSTSLDSGSVSLKGDIYFDGNEPDVNIKYELDRAEIPVLGKSVINASGEGIILGNRMPYNVGGEIVLNKVLIVNELNEFNSKSASLGQVRFLPKNQESPISRLINLDLNIKVENPARINNSLMDVGLKGEIRLTGSPVRPRGDGRLYSPVNSSRIFFKNNEYFITNTDLNFTPKKEITNPDFDIQAVTTISSYRVNAKAYGDLERFNFDLTSDPILPRQSILSLIAFGYTDEIQSTLDPKEQQNLTQVGVGSFVFDRFKITDILNKQFGLQVNLGTVFEQSETESMLEGRSQEGAGGTLARTRSATKIELKKRLDEALTLSVSSTMGGSIGQRQSMNLTYNVNKKVQLEGVYELRTNDEGQEDVIDNSLGGDIKFRWTFK